MAEGPTPQQQADYLVRKLEQTIRDNRTVKGMSFATWQAIAREEIANAIASSERRYVEQDRATTRLMVVGACSLITIGFWGAVVAVDRAYGGPAALIMLAVGLVMLVVFADWGIKRAFARHAGRKRAERLARIEDLDRRIKRMETELQKKHDRVKEKMEQDFGVL